MSRAAVEAWEAAETWATVLAAATGAVAATGEGDSTSNQSSESIAGTRRAGGTVRGMAHPPVTTARIEATGANDHCGQSLDEDHAGGRAGRGDSCFFSERYSAGTMGICRSALHRRDSVLQCSTPPGLGDFCESAVHRRDAVLCGSSSSKIAPRLFGCGCPTAAHSYTSEIHRHTPVPTPEEKDGAAAAARWKLGSSDTGRGRKVPSETVGHPTAFPPVVVVGAAAITVLARIERGDRLWRRRARSAGFAALRAHRTRERERKARNAIAARHCTAALWVRGMKAFGARVKRKEARRVAAAAAATTGGAYARAWKMRTGLAMLKMCVALVRDSIFVARSANDRLFSVSFRTTRVVQRCSPRCGTSIPLECHLRNTSKFDICFAWLG